ncbi:MAG: hypothetical protein OER85_14390 [Gammaproteobacteria bacterium]|nr:hypothetical protein [Gammaproteobacteria bacterium]
MGKSQNSDKVLEELDQQWRRAYAEKLAAWEKFRWAPFDAELLAEYETWSEKVQAQTQKIVDFKHSHGN